VFDWFFELVSNPFLITSTAAWFIAQVIKVIINAIINKKLDWERLVGDGGMPSGHSATVSSLATLSALMCGLNSFEFGVAGILAIIVCHDAMGVRREAGKHAVILNELTKAFEELANQDLPEVALKEFVGHTPVQVLAGIIIGVLSACVMYFFLI
jgi:acid phosphatase family membrane protein YuiD